MRFRIATFNLENWDDIPSPSLETRIAVMRPMLQRISAEVLCLQEVNGQGTPADLTAMRALIEGTRYQNYDVAVTREADGGVSRERNLVILSQFPIASSQEFKHSFIVAPQYRKVTSIPPEPDAKDIQWERPALHAVINAPFGPLHVINLHLKSRIPTSIAGQQINPNTWRSVAAFAEGFFVSSLKRVGQALEVRIFLDSLFDADPDARIIVCGDLNADVDDVPVQALRGDVEDTGNGQLAARVMIPCERTVPEPARFTLYHQGKPTMLDHLLLSRPLLANYRNTEIHNEVLHDESVAFALDTKFPESDHAPVIAEFEFPG